MIEDTQLWSEAGDKQEMAFYRRFASYLDTLLIKTGCSSSKIAIETNKQLFHAEDLSATYVRKIDLILRYNDRKSIDLCSNEWKRSKVTSELKLKQQSKNLRVNASIMNSLHSFGASPSSLLTMDMIGLHGYIYQLTKVDDYFIATPYSVLVIPRRFSDIAYIENTLLALFKFKVNVFFVYKRTAALN
ncbi:uncharacterized protein BX663DRAFT_459346 [Cokeromyces recurvatus]|uniref:uncharacterized protein n=1 Tax=Cokeromyces recurvatus TaxID=90255 RepID=UPI00221F8396|nr:uncharacterized protein BX663DRAFT_459346 [Cokeromyces recurvatus]KAI7900020.1 hypothetical protein BX663DRAFT_459346 [Cokeromyces recurvatus]